MVRGSSASRGFTLVEMLVASAVAGIAIASAFTFATFQIRGYSEQQDTQDLSASSRALLDTVIEDVRLAGMNTSFYAGVSFPTAFGGRAVVSDGTGPLGVPAISVLDGVNAPTSAAPGEGVMVGSDAITLLRVEGEITYLPSSGPGNVGMPPQPGSSATYTVLNQAALRPCIDAVRAPGLVLVSDMLRQGEPASMLLELDLTGTWGAANADGSGGIRFRNNTAGYAINPGAAGIPNGVMPAGRVFGPGSIVACVRLVTYWLDNIGRVRAFEANPASIGGAVDLFADWPAAIARPIDPLNDAVVADNVRDLQVEVFMSGMAPFRPTGWAFDAPPGGGQPPDQTAMVEARSVRITALIATPRAGNARALNVPANIANHALVAADYPNTHTYRLVSYSSEMRNLRHFDLMSSSAREWDEVRSYPQ